MSSPRVQEEVLIGRRAVARLRGEIGRIDPSTRSTYVRAFQNEFPSIESQASFDDLIIACYKADLVYIGDFHALPRSQEFAARLIREIATRSRRAVLAVEMVYGHHQHILDRWMSGEIPEAEFLKRIRYQMEWGYAWSAFSKVFLEAREHGLKVYGIDSAPRTGMRNIRQRDRHMAARIADIYAEWAEAKVVVLVGESHLASRHLPTAVRDALARRNTERRAVRVFQNLEEPYWQLVSSGREHVDTARVGRNVYCVFNSTPLEKMEAYRQTIELWNQDRPGDDEIDLTPTVYSMIDSILKFLRVNKFRRSVRRNGSKPSYLVDTYPEIYSSVDASDFTGILEAQQVPRAEIDEVRYHLGRNGSCYVPRINSIYIGTFSLVHGGEEAAHFVNHALRGDLFQAPVEGAPADHFYAAVLNEALGFFGSKIIDPSRNHFFESKFYRYYSRSRKEVEEATEFSYEEFRRIIDFILLHKKFERNYQQYESVPPELLAGIRTTDRRLFSILTHELGYFLGQQIYDGVRASLLSHGDLKSLFSRRFARTREAFRGYLSLTERLPGGFEPPEGG